MIGVGEHPNQTPDSGPACPECEADRTVVKIKDAIRAVMVNADVAEKEAEDICETTVAGDFFDYCTDAVRAACESDGGKWCERHSAWYD